MREAPSIMIIKELVARGAEISAYDPVVKKTQYLEGIKLTYATTKEECVSKSDAILLVTEWQEFIEADWAKLMTYSNNAVVFDGRNILKF